MPLPQRVEIKILFEGKQHFVAFELMTLENVVKCSNVNCHENKHGTERHVVYQAIYNNEFFSLDSMFLCPKCALASREEKVTFD